MRLLTNLVLMGVAALSLVVFGLVHAVHQQAMLTGARTVSAEVVAVAPQRSRITYKFEVDGVTQRSGRLMPLPRVLPVFSAEGELSKLTRGSTVDIHVYAGQPYLFRWAQAYPYLLIWLGLAVGLVGLSVVCRSGAFHARPTPQPAPGSAWSVLPRSSTVSEAIVWRLLEAVGWLAITFTCVALYLVASPRPYDLTILLLGAGLVVGAVPLMRGWRWSRLAVATSEPQLTTMHPQVSLDRPVIAHLGWSVRQPLAVREVRVALVCLKHHGLRAQKLFVTSQVVVRNQTIQPDRPLDEECSLEVPRVKRRPSSRYEPLVFPRVDWRFELHITPEAGGPFVMRFPVEACATAAEASAKATPSAAA